MAGLGGAISQFQNKITETERKLENNPFSDNYVKPNIKTTDAGYGRAPPGSKSEKRAIKAGNYVCREIVFLCEIIDKYGKRSTEGDVTIKFGYLFDLYATYSDKLVGMLLRARKYALVQFEGEMLYQRRDDDKDIVMVKTLDEIKASMQQSGDPVHCMAANK